MYCYFLSDVCLAVKTKYSSHNHATYESLTIKCFWFTQQKEGAVVVFLLAAKVDGLKSIDKRQWPGKNHQSPRILAMDLVDPNAWQIIGTEKCIFRQTNADTVTLTLVGATTQTTNHLNFYGGCQSPTFFIRSEKSHLMKWWTFILFQLFVHVACVHVCVCERVQLKYEFIVWDR